MTRHELGLMLLVLALSVAGGISWRLFRPHRGAHVYDLAPVPIPRLEYGSMILEEETRLRGDWQDAYVRELAPETLDEENGHDDASMPWPGLPGDGPVRDACMLAPLVPGAASDPSCGLLDMGQRIGSREPQPLAGDGSRDCIDEPADLISMMSDEDFFHMARFEFRRLEWMASEPLTLPAWTGRAA